MHLAIMRADSKTTQNWVKKVKSEQHNSLLNKNGHLTLYMETKYTAGKAEYRCHDQKLHLHLEYHRVRCKFY